MKRYISLFLVLSLAGLTGFAQSTDDIYRISQNLPDGSARFIGMSGAFGSLGGDLSALSYNPAGLGVFQHSELSFSPGFSFNKTRADYLGTSTDDFKYNFGMRNLGTVLSIKTGGLMENVNVGFSYTRLNDFNNYTRIQGYNPTGSLVDYFFTNDYVGGDITGIDPEDLDPFWERLAFDAYVIDTIEGTDFEYSSPVPYGVDMTKVIDSYGKTTETSFSLGFNFKHKFYFGASLGIQNYSYSATISHTEEWEDSGYEDYFTFRQELLTEGTGVNFKAGIIYRPINLIRIGLAFHTPTFYQLEDEMYNTMESSFVSGVVVPTDADGYALDPDYINYKVVTPFKAIASVGVQVGKLGVFNLDYEYVDYSSMRFREGSSSADFTSLNEEIQESFKPVSNIRAGGELKLGMLALRAGYALYGSPYKEGLENDDAHTSGISAGIGIREKDYYFDLGYMRTGVAQRHYLYDGEDDGAYLENSVSKFVATIGFKF